MDETIARFLTSPAGARALDAARTARALPLHHRARALAGLGSPEDLRAALAQDDLRRRAAERCPHADALLFTADALEQATAWPVAEERARRWSAEPRGPLTDLGAGIGLDALAAALAGRDVRAFERDPVRARLLAFNAAVLGMEARVDVVCADVLEWAPSGDEAYFDPDRRPGGTRSRDPAQFDPPFETWAALLGRFERAIVKLPPVVEGEVPRGPQEVVSLGGRARERRWFAGGWASLPTMRALALPSGRWVAGEPEMAGPAVGPVDLGAWLLDPDVSVTLARLVGALAARDGLLAAHPEIPYLVAGAPVEASPGHWIRVDALLPPKPGPLNRWLGEQGIGRLTIRKRGIEEQAATWRKRLHPKGPRAGTLVFTRDARDRWVVYGSVEEDAG